jgi:hypothetical protein
MNKAIYDYENNFVLPNEKLTLNDIVQSFLYYTDKNKKLNTSERYKSI